jgi:hypothetical protein
MWPSPSDFLQPGTIRLSHDQLHIKELVEHGFNVFYTGGAGEQGQVHVARVLSLGVT